MAVVDDQRALLVAAHAILAPLAKLMVAGRVPYESLEQLLKGTVVEASRQAHAGAPPHEMAARISRDTGLDVQQVQRVSEFPAPALGTGAQRSLAAELFTRWRTSPSYQDAAGRPRVLAREGEAPSFESLARSVSKDRPPSSLLNELVRLGLAAYLPDRDVVVLLLNAYVPSADLSRMLQFLAHNVGDHLNAAVENVVGDTPRHVERAVFASGLSRESIDIAERWVSQQWERMLAELAPLLESLLARDEADPERPTPCRFRAGLYGFACDSEVPAANPPTEPIPAAAGVRPDHSFAESIRDAFIGRDLL
jgi:hypothetical protein